MWLLACSGPGAMLTIAGNLTFTRYQALLVAILTALSLALWVPFNRCIRYPAACLLLLSFHPAWTFNPMRGDCGHSMATGAAWVSLFTIIVVIFHVRYAIRSRRSRMKQRGPATA